MQGALQLPGEVTPGVRTNCVYGVEFRLLCAVSRMSVVLGVSIAGYEFDLEGSVTSGCRAPFLRCYDVGLCV